jgi:peptidyl-prolyl cis-trans isomerase SurA
MHKKIWFVIIGSIMIMTASSQTLFTYGGQPVDAKEFIRAFNKNNQASSSNKSKAMRDYLELYINSKLKVQEAIDRGYDTLPMIKSEMENLRMQIIENYMSDPKTEEKLLNEAFQRSLKDIHVAHIFISFKNSAGIEDTIAANQKLRTVQQRLQKGEDFMKVAQEISDDPAAKNNKGDIGYITVFSLPYEIENIVYTTPPGKYSQPLRSKSGFHIFKNLGERKGMGKMKAQQILLAFPPDSDEYSNKQIGL